MLLHNTPIFVTILLVCLSLSGKTSQAAHADAEAQASKGGEAPPPQYGGTEGAAAAENFTLRTQKSPSKSQLTDGNSQQTKRKVRSSTLGENGMKESPEGIVFSQTTTTQGTVKPRKTREVKRAKRGHSKQSITGKNEVVIMQGPKDFGE